MTVNFSPSLFLERETALLRLTEHLLTAYLLTADKEQILYIYLKFRFHYIHFVLQFPVVNFAILLVSFRRK